MFDISKSREISDRRDFGALCNFYGLKQAYEIGVYLGEFASDFMKQWRGTTLHLVDPYEPYEEMPWDRTADLMIATQRMAKYGERIKFYRMRSPEILRVMNPLHVVDFVYIDGSHLYENVTLDINSWWERLSEGGILAGHDFDEEHDGVRRSVEEFGRLHDIPIYLTYEAGTSASWYTRKPKKTESPIPLLETGKSS